LNAAGRVLGTRERTEGPMLSNEANERLTRVGPGTPMGALLRRYWHPVATVIELESDPVVNVRNMSVRDKLGATLCGRG